MGSDLQEVLILTYSGTIDWGECLIYKLLRCYTLSYILFFSAAAEHNACNIAFTAEEALQPIDLILCHILFSPGGNPTTMLPGARSIPVLILLR